MTQAPLLSSKDFAFNLFKYKYKDSNLFLFSKEWKPIMQFPHPTHSQKSHNHFPKAWWILSLNKMDIEIVNDEYIKQLDKIHHTAHKPG